jgi:universal stress protein A
MRDYTHILAAVDFHEDVTPVIQRAQDIAARYRTRLSMIHVVEPLPVDTASEALLPPSVGLETELYENAERKLKEIAQQMGLTNAQRYIAIGHTKREILTYAEEHRVDLIVVGSHGRHGLALLLGSTANAVLHGAPCDVLAVRI